MLFLQELLFVLSFLVKQNNRLFLYLEHCPTQDFLTHVFIRSCGRIRSCDLIVEPISFVIRLLWMLFCFIRLIANDPIITNVAVGTCVLTDQLTLG